jgi:hypothetical protein
MIEENLVGYVLNALDPDAQREVEGYLQSHPETQDRLESIRQALEPLAADREPPEPPPGLRIRTLSLLAEYRCRDVTHMPPAPPIEPAAPVARSWWRRADVLVAASLLLVCVPILFPMLLRMQRERYKTECRNNLRSLGEALGRFAFFHNGALPQVEDRPPRNFAGVFVPILKESGQLTDVSVDCPATGRQAPAPVGVDELEQMAAAQLAQYSRTVGGCYAYPLGYRHDGRLVGLRHDGSQADGTPLVADRPGFESPGGADWLEANSPNHGGEGQNVLFLGGDVRFFTSRRVGVNGDDIYLNQNNQLDAGVNILDSVLAASGVRLAPTTIEQP